MKHSLILLDFDGTLFDTLEAMEYIFSSSFKDIGISIDINQVPNYMRNNLRLTYQENGGTLEQVDYFVKRINYYVNSKKAIELSKVFDDTVPFIKKSLENNIKLGIVTSNNKNHVKDVLEYFNINPNDFIVIIGNQETNKHKPNPEPILKGLELTSYLDKKEEVIYIGDGLDDKKSAENAGVDFKLLDRFNEYVDIEADKIKSLMDIYE